MGIDDMIFDPCGCIFGETQPDPVPIPGARFNRQMSNQASMRSRSSMRASRHGGPNPVGRTQSQEPPSSAGPEESPSPFAAFFGIVGG